MSHNFVNLCKSEFSFAETPILSLRQLYEDSYIRVYTYIELKMYKSAMQTYCNLLYYYHPGATWDLDQIMNIAALSSITK